MTGSATLTFAVGGIYGRPRLLEAALAAISNRADAGTVVFLGNVASGGEGAVRVVDRLMAGPPAGWTWICLLGSDENELIEEWGSHRFWPASIGKARGALATGRSGSIPAAHLDWCTRLPLVHFDAHRVYVHAGLDEAFGVNEQPIETALYSEYPECDDGGYGGKHVVHARVPAARTRSGRTSVEPSVGCGGLCVAVFADDQPGGPVEAFEIGEEGARARHAATREELLEGLSIEQQLLWRIRELAAYGDLNDVQLANWPKLVLGHQRAIFEYRRRLAGLEIDALTNEILDSFLLSGHSLEQAK